jgi:small-conductance mechanosensitive channel
MMEWIFIAVLTAALVALLRVFYNVVKTMDNMRNRLVEVSEVVKDFREQLDKLNSAETYYGDPTLEAFVKMTNDVDDALDDILNIRRELTGEMDAAKEN